MIQITVFQNWTFVEQKTSSTIPPILQRNIQPRNFSKREHQLLNVSTINVVTTASTTDKTTTEHLSSNTSKVYTVEIKLELYPSPEKLIDPGTRS